MLGVAGFPGLMEIGAVVLRPDDPFTWASGLRAPIDVCGPPPIQAMVDSYWQLNTFDIETRIADEGRPDPRRMVRVREFTREGVVLQNPDVKVTADSTCGLSGE